MKFNHKSYFETFIKNIYLCFIHEFFRIQYLDIKYFQIQFSEHLQHEQVSIKLTFCNCLNFKNSDESFFEAFSKNIYLCFIHDFFRIQYLDIKYFQIQFSERLQHEQISIKLTFCNCLNIKSSDKITVFDLLFGFLWRLLAKLFEMRF